jgi:hypothetical protein
MIELPNNHLGGAIVLCLITLSAMVPFAVVLWVASLVAPWWVALPVAIAAGVVLFVKLVKFKEVHND